MSTRFKKNYTMVSMGIAIAMSVTMFFSDSLWGLIGLPIGLSGAWVIGTIQDHHW